MYFFFWKEKHCDNSVTLCFLDSDIHHMQSMPHQCMKLVNLQSDPVKLALWWSRHKAENAQSHQTQAFSLHSLTMAQWSTQELAQLTPSWCRCEWLSWAHSSLQPLKDRRHLEWVAMFSLFLLSFNVKSTMCQAHIYTYTHMCVHIYMYVYTKIN
jgi:hypothetical protein